MKGPKVCVAVAKLGSVTEVSNRLALNQPDISRQITAMEEDVGFALFDRVCGCFRLVKKVLHFCAMHGVH
jgi:DNA-binding transcriptional LysR family regulator